MEEREWKGDGTAVCEECGYHFGVVECEDQSERLGA